MPKSRFTQRCLSDTLHGLREGLSLFSGAKSRVAVIYSISPSSDPFVYDPQGLLPEHAPKIAALLHKAHELKLDKITLNAMLQEQGIDLDGLISFGSPSQSLTYQVWFTEYHPTICSVAPIRCWLEYAMQCISNDLNSPSELYTGISGNFLREYATHSVRDALVDTMNITLGIDIHMRVYPILHAILEISKIKEEGALPFGRIVFAEPMQVLPKIDFLAKFKSTDQPRLSNYKHVRKTLQAVERSDAFLVSDGLKILGVATEIPDNSLMINFQGKLGFLEYNHTPLASLNNAGYTNNTFKAKLVEVEDILLDYPLDDEVRTRLFKIVEHLVHNSQDQGFGACLIIDLEVSPSAISGQALMPPIHLDEKANKDLACALAKVDGALHLRADLKLHAFACLLDGGRIERENAARGARYNSALRFSYHNHNNIVVVVSSDRPVSVIYRGQEVHRGMEEKQKSTCMFAPQNIYDWLNDVED